MSPPSSSAETGPKARLRREALARRSALPVAESRAASRRAVRRVWSLPFLARSRSLALYLPVGRELDCTPLLIQAWQRCRTVFLPVIAGSALRFAPYDPHTDLRPNCFGIPEPATHASTLRTARQLDVIIAPLVAFDTTGGRLGMGGGYYDRTLAFVKRRACARRPYFVGIAFETQKVGAVPMEEWDVRLDAIVTEQATYRIA